jgi:hypothetical protein
MAKKKRRKPNLSAEALERARRELRGETVEQPETKQPQKPARKTPQQAGTAPDEQPTPVATATPAPTTAQPAAKPRPAARQEQTLGTKRTMSRQELAAEYGYVINDLTSMAILAVILFIAMVAVSLMLDQII